MSKRLRRREGNVYTLDAGNHQVPRKVKQVKDIRPLNDAQAAYFNSINVNDLTFGVGPAGTGKTFIAAWLMARALDEGHVERLVITRPAIEAGEKLGFLPGTEAEKWEPFFRPVKDALEEYFGKTKLEYLLKAGTIETRPIAFLRGSTLKYAFILLDEAQNLTPNQVKMFLTRLGEGSKTIVNGDPTQCDLNISVDGLTDAVQKLEGLKGVETVHFTSDDIVRSGLVREITSRYELGNKRHRNKPIAVYAETPNDEGLKKFLGVT